MTTKENFLNFISEQVATYWAESNEPLLLSHVPALVTTRLGFTYKDVTDGISLKRFLHSESLEGNVDVKVVYHPVIKALVGLIPKDASYTFIKQAVETSATSAAAVTAGSIGNEQVVRDFLAIVAKLPSQEAQKVIIPMEILTQLMFGK